MLQKTNSTITLTPEQIAAVICAAKKSSRLTYAKVREAAGISNDYAPDPNNVRGKITEEDPYGEGNEFGGLKAYHDIRSALKNLPDDWGKVDNEATLNHIAYVLTVQKSDEQIRAKLEALPVSDEAKAALLKIKPTNFKTFGHLSVRALRKITPYIVDYGMTYSKACEAAGYKENVKVDLEQITNPVVKRAIAQTNKIVQAIIRKYGKPHYINVETARDLVKSHDDRKAIENENKENQAYNEDVKSIIELGYEAKPKTKGGRRLLSQLQDHGAPLTQNADSNGQRIIKVKLYCEQQAKCLYSGKNIDLPTMLHDDNAYQIDHIVPQSRSNNDGLSNKALVLTDENQNKANRTPYEYFGSDEARWQQYVARVEATYKTRDVKTTDKLANRLNYKYNSYALKKKQNLLLTEYKSDSWGISHLQNTRYIARFVQNYLRSTVFDDRDNSDSTKRVFTPNGATTSYLRKRWGLNKIREADVLHHAADAAIVAAIDSKLICKVNYYAKKHEITRFLANAKTMQEKTDMVTGEITDDDEFTKAQQENMAHKVLSEKHFPEPWTDFAKEVRIRTLNADVDTVQNELRGLENYDEKFRLQVRPIFVSRMPNRKGTSKVHKDTVRSMKADENDMRTVRTPLTKVKLKDLDNSLLDQQLYNTLRKRLEENGDDPDKAFPPSNPVFKYDKSGNPVHQVRAIKVKQKPSSGFLLQGNRGFVVNGVNVRLDIYSKVDRKGKLKYYFVPISPNHIPLERRGEKITEIVPETSEYTNVDNSFTKEMSVYKNDYLRIYYKNGVKEGYFQFYESDGRFNLMGQADAVYSKAVGRAAGRSATLIERYDISILSGNAPKV